MRFPALNGRCGDKGSALRGGAGIKRRGLPYNNGMEYEKVYVEVVAKFPAGGGMRPLYLVWEDGRKYEVDRVKFAERAPARVPSETYKNRGGRESTETPEGAPSVERRFARANPCGVRGSCGKPKREHRLLPVAGGESTETPERSPLG